MTEIKIATDFSRYPGGRYRRLGKFSGEEFRDDLLAPSLKNNDEVVVIVDGTSGYGSSFLEEAFGGLVRLGFSLVTLKEKLKPLAKDAEFEIYVEEIWQYVREAEDRKTVSA